MDQMLAEYITEGRTWKGIGLKGLGEFVKSLNTIVEDMGVFHEIDGCTTVLSSFFKRAGEERNQGRDVSGKVTELLRAQGQRIYDPNEESYLTIFRSKMNAMTPASLAELLQAQMRRYEGEDDLQLSAAQTEVLLDACKLLLEWWHDIDQTRAWVMPFYYAVTHVQRMQFILLRRVTDGVADSGPGQSFEIQMFRLKFTIWNHPDFDGPLRKANPNAKPWCAVIDVDESVDYRAVTMERLVDQLNKWGTIGDSACQHMNMLMVGAGKPQSRKYSGAL